MPNRRDALKQGLLVAGLLAGAGLFPSEALAAYNQRAFEAKGWDAALKALGSSLPTESKDISLQGPDLAENGAQVALTTATTLPGVKRLLVLVDKNPAALVALFEVGAEIEANFMLRTKMNESSAVYAVAIMNDGRALFARKDIQVTQGGCGN